MKTQPEHRPRLFPGDLYQNTITGELRFVTSVDWLVGDNWRIHYMTPTQLDAVSVNSPGDVFILIARA